MKSLCAYILSILLMLLAPVVWSCGGDERQVVEQLDCADSIMEAAPDSAYTLLYNIDSLYIYRDAPKSLRARYLLLLGTAMNNTDRPMTFDSLFLNSVVHYYDSHGTPNERMRARYIMGCIARDMHEAPRAIDYYMSATECADTLAADCDYLTLMRIYGQMALIYHGQYMPLEELDAYCQYTKCAELCDNIYEYIRGIELRVSAYQIMSDTASILATIDSVYDLYIQNDMPQEAVSIYPAAIFAYIDQQDYTMAKHLMDIFEQQSGLFDGKGNIVKEREIYYDAKGRYYEGIGKLDSAKYYYHRVIKAGYDFDGYSGLLRVYQITGTMPDSITYASKMKDSAYAAFLNTQHKEATMAVKNRYDYKHWQKAAKQAKTNAETLSGWNKFMIILLFVTVIVFIVIMRKHNKRVDDDMKIYYKEHEQQLEQVQQENNELKQKNSEHTLSQEILQFAGSDIAAVFRQYATGENKGKPTEYEWRRLNKAFGAILPEMLQFFEQHKLTNDEQRVCMLSLLSISPSVSAILMKKQNSAISNLRKKAGKKLFKIASAAELDHKLSHYTKPL